MYLVTLACKSTARLGKEISKGRKKYDARCESGSKLPRTAPNGGFSCYEWILKVEAWYRVAGSRRAVVVESTSARPCVPARADGAGRIKAPSIERSCGRQERGRGPASGGIMDDAIKTPLTLKCPADCVRW